MKLDRKATIARIDDLIAESRKVHAEQHAKKVADYEAAVAKWQQEKAPALLVELRSVAEKVRKGRYPVKTRLFEQNYNNSGIWGSLPDAPKATEYVPNPKLLRLRAILDGLTADEFVTTASLRELGFNPSLFIA